VLRLRGKIDYTDVGFRFLNDLNAFSLSELQTVFEAVLGRKLDNSNFRRFIRNRYEETGRMVLTDHEDKQGRGRPAALYQLKETGVKQR
jgi:8-oxo-dGTP diphosphatase